MRLFFASPRPSPPGGEGDMKALKFLQHSLFTNDKEPESQINTEFPICGVCSLPIKWGGLGWGGSIEPHPTLLRYTESKALKQHHS